MSEKSGPRPRRATSSPVCERSWLPPAWCWCKNCRGHEKRNPKDEVEQA